VIKINQGDDDQGDAFGYRPALTLTGMRAGLAGGGARKETLTPVGATAGRYQM
jgi:hypothetical protein